MNRLVVVSNRVPVPGSGGQAGGLAVALEGLMQRHGGLWFGWSGQVADNPGTLHVTEAEGVRYCTVDLTQDEHDRYYTGFSNSVLWPLLHSMPELLQYDRRDGAVYRHVNERLVECLAPQLRPTDMIWVHDYHLMAMPALLRARGVIAPVGYFLHIPFPSPDVLGMLPEAGQLLRDLLAADLLGFQTDNDVENFTLAAQRLAGATRLAPDLLMAGGRRVRIGAFPVEIEPRELAVMAEEAWRTSGAERLRRSLHGQKLILGVDRLDPTKGLMQRLAGYRRLLETRPEWRRHVTLLQIAPVSRKEVESYRELRDELDREAGSINSDWGEADWNPLRVIARGGPRATMAGYMREARVGLVTPLRDGMNLVAKEYVAAQDPQNPGVLVLSRFAGAARQLTAALLVNPHDPDEIAEALDRALHMPLAERQDRWQAMWQAIEGASPIGWGRSFVAALLRAGAQAHPVPSASLTPIAATPIALREPPIGGFDPRRVKQGTAKPSGLI
ncbi:MAG TPA: trehalose-6-phosphate synthase [Acetobacteraceae bacterium]|nr:trehalose-6-phosphate synthase [Acetobacteraceae bacterium]